MIKAYCKMVKIYFEGKQCVHIDKEKHSEILPVIVFEW